MLFGYKALLENLSCIIYDYIVYRIDILDFHRWAKNIGKKKLKENWINVYSSIEFVDFL